MGRDRSNLEAQADALLAAAAQRPARSVAIQADPELESAIARSSSAARPRPAAGDKRRLGVVSWRWGFASAARANLAVLQPADLPAFLDAPPAASWSAWWAPGVRTKTTPR